MSASRPVTIVRWYYTAPPPARRPGWRLAPRRAQRLRQDLAWLPALAERLHLQYHDHPDWSCQLHYDNLAALVEADPALGPLPSYSTVKRVLRARGLVKQARGFDRNDRPGEASAETKAGDARGPQL